MNDNRVRHAITALALATLVLTASPAHAAEGTPLAVTLGPGSVLWLEGTSNVHDFESRSKEVQIEFSGNPGAAQPTDAAAILALIRSSAVHGVLVKVAVNSLRSDKEGLDKRLRKAMQAEEYANVAFSLKQYVLSPSRAGDDTVAIQAEGSLAIAGRELPISLEARAYRAAEGVWLEGSETLLMSDYGIKPPRMMLGTLRVRDPITVRYRLFLIPKGK